MRAPQLRASRIVRSQPAVEFLDAFVALTLLDACPAAIHVSERRPEHEPRLVADVDDALRMFTSSGRVISQLRHMRRKVMRDRQRFRVTQIGGPSEPTFDALCPASGV